MKEGVSECVETNNLKELQAKLEAILFTMGEAVERKRLAAALQVDEETLCLAAEQLQQQYASVEHGIQLIELNGAFQLCTKSSMYEAIIRITHVPKKHILTDVLLETLSIIAYKQPITKQEIEAIRGVKTDHAVNKLVEYNLVCEVGRLDAPGRPILFGTTEEFLRCFGISSLEELPMISSEQVADFKQEAEAEIKLQLEP